jgi:hypothetical protein
MSVLPDIQGSSSNFKSILSPPRFSPRPLRHFLAYFAVKLLPQPTREQFD